MIHRLYVAWKNPGTAEHILHDSIYVMFKIWQNKLTIIELRIVITLEEELLIGKAPDSGAGNILHLDLDRGYFLCIHVKIYWAAIVCTFLHVYSTSIRK